MNPIGARLQKRRRVGQGGWPDVNIVYTGVVVTPTCCSYSRGHE